MRRFYRACPRCRRRMRLIGTSSETYSEPPTPIERYYRCPTCETEWTYNVERNFQSPGVPAHLSQPGGA